MSVDERLRIGMSRNAQTCDPDVELLLESALARRRQGRTLRWAGAAAGLAAAACAAAVMVSSGGLGRDNDWPPLPADATASRVPLQGRFAGEVAALPQAPSVAGRW